MNTTLTNDLCNEVRDLRERLDAMRDTRDLWQNDYFRMRDLLATVLDAGRPHSHLCGCDGCNAWLAVRKELRGE